MYLDALVALEETEMLAFFVFPTETKRGWKSGLQQSAGKTGSQTSIPGFADVQDLQQTL